ncbi:MAG: endonuclease/exonuclease/phosphatase family protein [Spirochaetaceae bacterium]|jgi:endonuclease/exonuclease/phosphatase family metal-dependent hydrolase|nr:endonuclease/exonuclease/phosphatase family protein [Spirochaetaceae bacterium]
MNYKTMQFFKRAENLMRLYGGFMLMTLPVLMGCLGGCDVYTGGSKGAGGGTITLASWNVQALFDGKDDGLEYEEYRDGSGWSEEKYRARLNRVGQGIAVLSEKSPDFIVFIEVENHNILEDLNSEYLENQKYRYSFFAGNSGYSLGIGMISKYPLAKTLVHSVNVAGEVLPRPVAEVWLDVSGGQVVIFACHWKSKLGGEESTEKLRQEAAKIIVRRQKELSLSNPSIPIVVLGDLNENYDEFYRRGSEQVCALLPDDPEAARKTGFLLPSTDETSVDLQTPPENQDFLIISGDKPPESAFFAINEGVFYSPWGNELANGSYFYNGDWETIDHILMNAACFDKTGIEFENCYVADCEPFVNSKGEPDRYNPRTGAGLSDHLPLVLILKML